MRISVKFQAHYLVKKGESMEEPTTLKETIQQTIAELTPDLAPNEKKTLSLAIEKSLSEGIPIRKTLGINDDTMEYLYGYGHRQFALRKYGSAEKIFQMLYMLNPLDSRYALGIAASYQMDKKYDQAIGWYLALSSIDENSPLPFYYMSDCFLKKLENKASLEYLKKTIERCGDNPEYANLKERALRMIIPLEAQIKKEEMSYDHQ